MQYDAWGNLIRRRSGLYEQHYTWDAENRLISAQGTGPQGRFQAHYQYDALGRRTRKQVATAHGTTETRFLWQGYRLLQEQHEDGQANRPNNGEYNIFRDFSLDPQYQYASDSVQFNRANTDFVNKMNTDPAFRRDMLGRYPQLREWVKNGDMGRSPTGLIWHHHEDVNRLVLVDRFDHRSNHALYHPTGSGGRDIWGGGKPGRQGKLNSATGKKC